MYAISGTDEAICLQCKSLLDLHSIFDSFFHSGRDLKRHKAIYSKPAGSSYANVKDYYDQNSIWVSNYLYRQNCVKHAFVVSTSRLVRLHSLVLQESSCPFACRPKEQVSRYSDIVLLHDCVQQPSA